MTTKAKPLRMEAETFIAWAMEQPQGRFELEGGEVVAMAPERAGHARVKLSAVNALAAGLKAKALPCEAMIDGMAVRIDERTVYEPDALVRCGPRLPGDTVRVLDPVVIVEVLSPSTRAHDAGAKLADYFRMPSVRHYLLADIKTRTVIHHERADDGSIATRIARDGAVRLDPPGIMLDVAELFLEADG